MVVGLGAALAAGNRSRGRGAGGAESREPRAASGRSDASGRPIVPSSFSARLERWTSAGLINSEQSAAIEEFEEREEAAERALEEHRVPLASEALGYLGGALVLAALALLIGKRWDRMNSAGHIGVLAAATAAVFVGGWVMRRSDEPAQERLSSLLLFLSSAGVGGTIGVALADLVEPEGHTAVVRCVLLAFVGVVAWSAPLWRIRRWPLQQLATFVGIVGVVMSSVGLDKHAGPPAYGTAGWLIGAVWVLLASRNLVQPPLVGYALGCFAALYSPVFIAQESAGGAVLLGLATACALTLAAVMARRPVLLLGGAVGLFAYVPATALHFFGDTLGTDLTLFIVGVLVLAIAVLVTRLRREVSSPV